MPILTYAPRRGGLALDRLNKVRNIALCTIFSVWWTTPTTIMQREAATPPIEHTLDHLCKMLSVQLHRLEP